MKGILRVPHGRCIWAAALALVAAATANASRPTVLSTDPVNGATGVAADLQTISITFSEEMSNGLSYSGVSGFDGQWEPGHQVFTITRSESTPPWTDGQIIILTLNPPPYYSFTDSDGNPLATHVITLTVGAGPISGTPTVLATTPPNGASDVAVETNEILIEFSEPMAESVEVGVSGPWPMSLDTPRSWSPDGRVLTLRRDNPSEPLPTFTVITLYLNPAGEGIEDLDGFPLGTYGLAMTTEEPDPDQPPEIQSSDPADESRGVGVFRDSFTVTFTKAMTFDFNMMCTTGNWDVEGSDIVWSQDARSFTLYRPDDGTLLPAGALVSFTLNPGNGPGFQDTFGNPLPETTISFNVEGTARLLRIRPQDSSHSFHWPYFLWVPANVAPRSVILVEPNNTGTTHDASLVHDGSALSLLGWRARFAERLNVPLLVPAFPRPRGAWWIYTHALDVDSMTTSREGIHRIDLQLIEMIDDARERLEDMRIAVPEKVLMMGFSASGQFTSRFALLHPERTLAAAAGSPGGWPLAPVASWQGETLNYHVGIADVGSLLGTDLDMDEVRSVPIFLYMGASDDNDSVPYGDAYDDDQREQVYRLFGMTPVERWPHAEAIYQSAGMNSTFALYPGVGHTITEEMFDDIAEFFLQALPEPMTRYLDPSGRQGPP
jgi:pimeloyl-ACP methyl ester carboxylesterase